MKIEKPKSEQTAEELDGHVTGTPLGDRQFNFGVPSLKMAVFGEIPGWHLCWIYEDALHTAQMDGYEFVKKGEVGTPYNVVPRDSNLGEHISCVVNKPQFDGGVAIHQFLMKVPNELYEKASKQINARCDAFDSSVHLGAAAYGKKGFYMRPDMPTTYNPIPK